MLKSLIQLVPFGIDENSKVISGFYIANVGQCHDQVGPDVTCNYVVGYFKKSSRFSKEPTAKISFISDWDNKQSTFALVKEIFGQPTWCWYSVEDTYSIIDNLSPLEIQAIEIFKQRAKKDGIYE
jgi:hypothetical protein